jgi:nucleoside-diphosphate-sugar epimerase
MQTILGAGGVIGRELAALLPRHTDRIRLVSRTPAAVNPDDELFPADLLEPDATAAAVEGSEVAYLTAGLRYDAGVWEEEWPRIMTNVVDACRRHGARLVFLDNVYAYGLVRGPMTEDTPHAPSSRKGAVRARITDDLMEAAGRGDLEAMILRAADFYGPGAELSITHATVISRLQAGKTPQWVGDPRAVHTFSYTRDVARSLALLGNRTEAYGQIWHALTHPDRITGEEFVRMACRAAGRPDRIQAPPAWVLRILEWFVPVLRENREMMYQFDEDYIFDSSKIIRAYGLQPTEYRDGIQAALKG